VTLAKFQFNQNGNSPLKFLGHLPLICTLVSIVWKCVLFDWVETWFQNFFASNLNLEEHLLELKIHLNFFLVPIWTWKNISLCMPHPTTSHATLLPFNGYHNMWQTSLHQNGTYITSHMTMFVAITWLWSKIKLMAFAITNIFGHSN
jgi:hypothetical protein